MRKQIRNILALVLAILLALPGTGVLATEEGEAVIPAETDYEFSAGTITGLKETFLNGLTEDQRKNLLLVIPAEIDGFNVEAIGEYAFDTAQPKNASKYKGCVYALDFTNAINLKTIGKQAFNNCEFRGELILPPSLTILGPSAFRVGNSDKSTFTGTLVLPSSLTSIGTAAFSHQEGLTQIVFPEDCKITDLNSTFRYCKGLTGALILPDSLQTLTDSAFAETGIETVYLPQGVTLAGTKNAFQSCRNLTALICANEAEYQRLSAQSFSNKNFLCYSIQVTLNGDSSVGYDPLSRLYGRPLNFIQQPDGCWRADPSFRLPDAGEAPEGYESKWSFSQQDPKGVTETDPVKGPALYVVQAYAPPTITYSEGIDKDYDGTPSEVSVIVSHPLYKPLSEAADGDVVVYYTWSWNTIGSSPAAQAGFDKNIYDVGGYRAPFAISCWVYVQVCELSGSSAKVFYTETHDFTINLRKGTPAIEPQFDSMVPFAEAGALPALTAGSAPPGNIAWAAGQTLRLGGGTYTWTFTPEDTVNYNTVSGTAYLYAYADDGQATPPSADAVLNDLLPTTDEPISDEKQQTDILGAKQLAEEAEASGESISQETRDALNAALARLPQVEIKTEGVAVQNESALLENMTATQAQSLLSLAGGSPGYQITLTAEPKEPDEAELAAVSAALDGAEVGPGHKVTVHETLTIPGGTAERELSQLRTPVKLTFSIPAKLAGSDRLFYLVRTHAANGQLQAELLPDEDNDPDTVTVTSDRFSYYALAWKDKSQNDAPWTGGITPVKPKKTPSDALTDIAGHWAEAEIRKVVDAGIFQGTTETEFSPDALMSRGMFVTSLYRLAGSPVSEEISGFSDVSAGTWYAQAVAWAAGVRIVNGYDDGSFLPGAEVTREQLTAFFYRDALRRGLPTDLPGDLSAFRDGAAVSPWAQDAVSWAVGSGLLSGRSGDLLAPDATATRAEVAVLFSRYMALLP